MGMFIEDERIDALAVRYQSMIHAETKQDAVRHALETVLAEPSNPHKAAWLKVVEIQKRLRDASPLERPLPYSKELQDYFYQD